MTHPPQDNPTRKKASWILRKFRRSSAAHETASSAAAATATATATTTANAANNAPALTPAHTPAHTPSHTPNHTPSHTPDPAPPSHIPPSASDHCRRSAPSSFTPVPPPPEPNSRSSRPDSASSSGSRPSSGPGHAPAMTGAAIGTTTTGTAARTRPASGPSRRPSSRLATSHAGSRSTPQPQPEPPASSRFRGKQRAVDPPEHAHASIPPSLLSHPPLPRRVQVPDARDRPLPAYRSSWDSASSRSTAAASGGGDRPPLRPAPIANGSLWRPQSMLSISSTSVTHGAGRGPSGSKPLQSSFPAPSRILWFDHDHDHHQGQDHDHDDPDFPRLRPRSLSLSLPRLDNSPSTEHDALETNSLFSDRSPSRASTKPTTLISFDPAPSVHHAHIAQAPPPRTSRARQSSDWAHARAGGTAPASAFRLAQRLFGHGHAPHGPSSPTSPAIAPSSSGAAVSSQPTPPTPASTNLPSPQPLPSPGAAPPASGEMGPADRERGVFRVLVTGQADDGPPREPDDVISVPGHHRPHPGFNPVPSSLPADNASVLTLASSNAAYSVAGTNTGAPSFRSVWGTVNDGRSMTNGARPGSIAGSLGGPNGGGGTAPRPTSIASHSYSYFYPGDPPRGLGSSWSHHPPSTGGAKSMTNEREGRRRYSSDTEASMRALAPLSRRGSGASSTTRTSTHALSVRSDGGGGPFTEAGAPSATSASILGVGSGGPAGSGNGNGNGGVGGTGNGAGNGPGNGTGNGIGTGNENSSEPPLPSSPLATDPPLVADLNPRALNEGHISPTALSEEGNSTPRSSLMARHVSS